ncbi:MAG TPA: frataxin domain-containing protein [Vicinamibacterales bacterium]|nr:frataxin domain-containing protein [Vicinamibacterales bacterium]
MTALTDQDFRVKSDAALQQARRALLPLADQEGFEVEFSGDTLNLLFEEPSEARFVVSPNAPVKQIWVSAMNRGYRLSWAPEKDAFALDGEPLSTFLARLAREFLAQA